MEFRKAGRVLACMAALSAPWTMAAGKCERLVATGSPDAPPYSRQDPKDPRHLIGANVDLLRQVAAELGVSVEVLHAGKRDQALEEVRSGRMDLLIDTPMQVEQLTALTTSIRRCSSTSTLSGLVMTPRWSSTGRRTLPSTKAVFPSGLA